MSKSTKIKQAWKKLITNSSIHGVPRVEKTNSFFIRSLWVIMILISLAGGLFIIRITIFDYQSFDVITQTKRIREKSVIFPAISICGLNFTSDMIVSCLFELKKCTLESFDYFRIPNGFFCLRFNGFHNESISLERSWTSDWNYGLQLNLSSLSDVSYFEIYIQDNYLNNFDGVMPMYSYKKYLSNLFFVKSVDIKLDEPYNNCTKMENENYRKVNCMKDCEEKLIIAKHNCYLPSFKAYANSELKLCPDSYNLYLNKSVKEEFESICDKECVNECHSIVYDTTHSGKMLDSLDDDSFLLYAFYADISYLKIVEIPKFNVEGLISSIGGTLSIFIGFKFLSLIEVVEFFIEVYFIQMGL